MMELLQDSANDFHVLCLRRTNGTGERVHLPLRVALGLLQHEFSSNILVGADGLSQVTNADFVVEMLCLLTCGPWDTGYLTDSPCR